MGSKAPDYGLKSYWDEQYRQPKGLVGPGGMPIWDWMGDIGLYGVVLWPELDAGKDRVLITGCGNSAAPFQLVARGFAPERVVSVDYSEGIIEQMRSAAARAGMPTLPFEVIDCRDMSRFEPGSFDVVLDKGMLDTLYCIQPQKDDVKRYAEEVLRVLRPGGRWLLITMSDSRELMLEAMNVWHVQRFRVLRNEDAVNLGIGVPEIYQTVFVVRKRDAAHP